MTGQHTARNIDVLMAHVLIPLISASQGTVEAVEADNRTQDGGSAGGARCSSPCLLLPKSRPHRGFIMLY